MTRAISKHKLKSTLISLSLLFCPVFAQASRAQEQPLQSEVPTMAPAQAPQAQQAPQYQPYQPQEQEEPPQRYMPPPPQQSYGYRPQYSAVPNEGYGDHFYGGGGGAEGTYGIQPSHYYGNAAYQGGFNNGPRSGTIYAPQGLNLPMTLQTAISTQVAKPGDLIQGEISQMVSLGGRGYIPAGTQVVGSVGESRAGRRLSRSGALSIEFTSMRLPSGQMVPINAHLVGDIGKYKNKGQGNQDLYRGEGAGTKVGQFFLRGLGGAGLGAALGTGLGAIAGGSHGVGRGAWGGAAIGGGLGAADMLLRKGRDVIVPSGTEVQIQLDEPVALPSFAAGGYNNGGGYNAGGYGGGGGYNNGGGYRGGYN